MSVKSKIVVTAAALTLVGGVGAAGTLTASAATPECGSGCISWYSPALGTAAHPGFVLGVLNQADQAGQAVILAPASKTNQGEDFQPSDEGLVSDFVAGGIINPGLDPLYGRLSVYEIQYTPHGTPTGMCVGVGATPGSGTSVTLEPCGVTARTTWIIDPETTKAGTYDALISGATAGNFQHPFSLATLLPREPLVTAPLVTAPLATSPSAALLDHQLWAHVAGALPAS
jgi:hypothetical protein